MACVFPNERITSQVVQAEIGRGWWAVSCPLCTTHAAACPAVSRDARGYICPACQRFAIEGPYFTHLQRLSEMAPGRARDLKATLSQRAATASAPVVFSFTAAGL